jgi:hypothetical protein
VREGIRYVPDFNRDGLAAGSMDAEGRATVDLMTSASRQRLQRHRRCLSAGAGRALSLSRRQQARQSRHRHHRLVITARECESYRMYVVNREGGRVSGPVTRKQIAEAETEAATDAQEEEIISGDPHGSSPRSVPAG